MVESPSNVSGFVESQVDELGTSSTGGDQGLDSIMSSSFGVMTIANTDPYIVIGSISYLRHYFHHFLHKHIHKFMIV